jgi:hypothetical protein
MRKKLTILVLALTLAAGTHIGLIAPKAVSADTCQTICFQDPELGLCCSSCCGVSPGHVICSPGACGL